MSAVVVCTWKAGGHGLVSGDQEALTIGRKIAAGLDVELRLLCVGGLSQAAAAEAGKFGVAGIDRLEDAKLTSFGPDAYVEAISQYCRRTGPRLLFMNQSFDARTVAPRLARRVRGSVLMNAVTIAGGLELARGGDHLEVTTAACGGDTRTTYELRGSNIFIVCLNDNACEPEPAAAASSPRSQEFAVDLSSVHERIHVLERPSIEGPKLEDAQIIVAGGRGLGEAGNFHLVEELARALGGVAGASRPIVDDGWAKPAQQVGLTGKITKPVLYIAAGISGASQHMVGCVAAKTLVAINTDRDAAIFRHARYGIVGDCREILPAIARAITDSAGD